MKHRLLATCAGLGIALAGVVSTTQAQPLVLTGAPYFQNFDNLSAEGLAGEWAVFTNASATSLGLLTTVLPGLANWGESLGGFKNLASTISNAGTNFLGTEPGAIQNAATNRALGIRQTGALGDPGAAFALRLANTHGFGNFQLNLDFLLLSVQGRVNVWAVDFGVSPDGASPPTSFTPVITNAYVALSTGSTPPGVFGVSNRTISFGNLLDNQPGPIWIRIVSLTTSSMSGARATFGIDNVTLTYEPVAPVVHPVEIVTQPAASTVFVADPVTFGVSVSGTGPFTYQWYHPDLSTPVGGDSAIHTILNASANDAGLYWVVVSNPINTVTSSPALLTVVERVSIVTNIAHVRTLQSLEGGVYMPNNTTNFFTVEGVVFTRTNMTTAANALFYMMDPADGTGIPVFIGGGAATRPARGDRMRVTGPLGAFNNLFQFGLSAANPTHIVENLGGGNKVLDPKPFEFSSLANLWMMETNYEGSLVVVSNVFFQHGGTGSNFVAGRALVLTNLQGQTMQFFCDARLTDIIGSPIPVFARSITGYMAQFGANHQIIPTWMPDIVPGTPPAPEPVPEPIVVAIADGNVVLSWTQPNWRLATGTNVFGVTNIISGAASPFTNTMSDPQRYFRLVYP